MKISPEQWLLIERLYHEGADLPPAERPAWLDQACAGDAVVRREVESLLAAGARAESFIETPPNDLAAAVLVDEHRRTIFGQKFSHYRILSPLGAGGMGEVYLAEDTSLGRKVALKLLPEDFTRERERVQRFKQEARAASALNHPNIITIFEIGQVDELHFIATEFIDGRTLRRRMADSPVPLREALDIVIQAAAALSAAHDAGIVHRDIKPENIMLRRDGYVKVLDFGLVKLLEPLREAAITLTGGDRATETKLTTDPGRAIGTPRYMSPEQIRAQEVDARTDIFSLGVVLYELIAGQAPFGGATPSEVVAAILHLEPLPLARFSPEVPAELERIVRKALRKDREERYRLAHELRTDLKNFLGEMEFAARLASARLPDGAARSAGDEPAPGIGPSGAKTRATPAPSREVSLSPGPVAQQPGRKAAKAGGVLLLAVLAAAGYYWMSGRSREASFQMERMIRLTATGKASRVAISPDGKEVLYSFLDEGQESLRLRQVDTGGEIETLPPEKVTYYGMTFSPDGTLVYYTRGEANISVNVLYQSTKYGGSPRRLCANVDSPIGFSPDGRQIAFVRQSGRDRQLVVADSACGGERVLAVRRQPDGFRLRGPAWSPDGKWIAVAAENLTGTAFHTLVGVSVADGTEIPLTARRWEIVNQAAWLADSSGLLVVATEPFGYQNQLWSQAWPKGTLRRITKDLNSYSGLSISTDSSRVATVQSERFMSIWVAPEADANRAIQITTGPQRDDGIRGLAWTPDGRIVYRSFAGGNPNVWIMKADGSENRQLSTSAHQNTDPMVSPDGSYIAWASDRIGVRNIWRMNLDGGSVRQLTGGAGEWFPQVTPDGKWLIYQALAPDELDRMIWKLPLDGGAPVRLTDYPSYAPVLSPEGKLIVCNYRERPAAPVKTAVLSIDGGPPLQTFDLPGANLPDRPVRWTPDGNSLAYIKVDDGVSNIWTQPLRGGPPKQLTTFKSEEILNFAWSRDGKQLALARGVTVSDVVLISSRK